MYGYYSSLLKAVDKIASSYDLLKDDDTESYRRMCTTTLVASKRQDMFDSKNDTFGDHDPIQALSMSDIIGKVTEVLFMITHEGIVVSTFTMFDHTMHQGLDSNV